MFKIFCRAPQVSYNQQTLLSQCNMGCSCSAKQWDPVCAYNGMTYASPCLAGCQTSTGFGKEMVKQQLCKSSKHTFIKCNNWIRVKSKCTNTIVLVLVLKQLHVPCWTYEISTQLRVLIYILVIWPSRYFITARASATWWPQAWTCQQCWASVPGTATVITHSKSTWLCLRWGPSFPPVGLRRHTSFCSGVRFKEAVHTSIPVTLQREHILIYYRLWFISLSY